jgi:hypothetical protein
LEQQALGLQIELQRTGENRGEEIGNRGEGRGARGEEDPISNL